MIVALIFRGVAFEFRMKAIKSRWIWDWSFFIGAVTAALAQGFILGAMIEGFKVEGRSFIGGTFDWLTPFSVTTAFAMLAAYGLLGSTWLILKTHGETYKWAKQITQPLMLITIMFVLMISIKTPLTYPSIADKWFSFPNIVYLSPVPIVTGFLFYLIVWGMRKDRDAVPFVSVIGIFLLSFLGLGISLFPYIVVPHLTIWQAAAPAKSLKFVLTVASVSLPIIIGYTCFVYYLFKGKVEENYY